MFSIRSRRVALQSHRRSGDIHLDRVLVDLASLLIERNDNEADGDDYDDATSVGPAM